MLTDQGPQYHSWRGKSAFDKLLDREGIRNVVSRTHHPQTLGKCERLWKTIAEELWQRAKPQDLAEQCKISHGNALPNAIAIRARHGLPVSYQALLQSSVLNAL